MNAPASPTSTALVVAAAAPAKMAIVRPIAAAEEFLQAKAELQDLLPKVLKRGIDVVKIPGTDKECLSKAGAERTSLLFGCHPEYEVVEKEINHDRVTKIRTGWVETDAPDKPTQNKMKANKTGRWKKNNGEFVWMERGEGEQESVGLYRYVVRCRIVRQDGLVVGDGIGSCSTMESKYIDRPRDCENTVIKMAQKRAFVGATLNAFGLSDRFTADVDGDDDDKDDKSSGSNETQDAEFTETSKVQAPPPPKPTPEQQAKAWALWFCGKLDRCETQDEYDQLLKDNKKQLEGIAKKFSTLGDGLNAYVVEAASKVGGFDVTRDDAHTAALKTISDLRGAQTTEAPAAA